MTDLYASYYDRTINLLTNAARMSPSGYLRVYLAPLGRTYACAVAWSNPLRYG
jgi:hypothetical protein